MSVTADPGTDVFRHWLDRVAGRDVRVGLADGTDERAIRAAVRLHEQGATSR